MHLLPSLQSLFHMILSQYSIIGYLAALFCVLMSTIDVIMLGEWRLGSITCNIWYTVDTLLNTTSAWLSTVLMLERLVCTEVPQLYLNIGKKCKTLVAFSPWALSLTLTLFGTGMTRGKFHNFVSNNGTAIDQCYIVDPDNETAIYSATVSFLLPYAITLFLFIAIKYKAAFKQTRLSLSRSLDGISDVLLDSDQEESSSHLPYCSEHNYSTPPEDTLWKVDSSSDTCHSNSHLPDLHDNTSPGNGRRFFQTRTAVDIGSGLSESDRNSCKKANYMTSSATCTHSSSRNQPVNDVAHKTNGPSATIASKRRPRQTDNLQKFIAEKRHFQANRNPEAIPFPEANSKRPRTSQHVSKSTPSAYLTALQKAQHERRVNRAFQEMNKSSICDKHRGNTCKSHSRESAAERVYFNKTRVPAQNKEHIHCSKMARVCCSLSQQCNSVQRLENEMDDDDSSTDSESSHGLIPKADETSGRPRKEHIVVTNVLEGEHLKTVHHITVVIVLYGLLWLPFYVLRLLLRFSPQMTIYHYVYTSLHLLGYFSSGVCPALYYLLHGYMKSSTWSNLKYRLMNPSHSESSTSTI